MKIFRPWVVALLVTTFTWPAFAEKLDFMEKFATSKDRASVLKQLIPGTRDYYYYHSLHHQNLGQLDKVDAFLKKWKNRLSCYSRCREIQHRQALLRYSKNPQATLRYLRRKLSIRYGHKRRVQGTKPVRKSRLKASDISFEKKAKGYLKSYSNSLSRFKDSALPWLATQKHNRYRLRKLLRRLRRPDLPNLPQLVVQELNSKYSRGFGAFTIHRNMLLSQLDTCLKLKPKLRNNTAFIRTYLRKLQPNPDIQWREDPKAVAAYLKRLWAFVKTLGAPHNSLKLHVLHHTLKLELSQGKFDQMRFIDYIRIPRYAPYVNSKYINNDQNRYYKANRNRHYKSTTLLKNVGNDEPLVRTFLAHFFRTEASYQNYTVYLKESYLKKLFAETKIVNGLGDVEKWASWLSPSAYKALKDKVELHFVPTNKTYFGASEEVKLKLTLKNVQTLFIKVYEINKRNYYRKFKREVSTSINLDGLVANEERVKKFKASPFLRVSHSFAFPSLKKRGTYVIDFIGNGKSSRALVHKGRLRHVVRTSVAGQVFTVLDEQGKPAKDPSIWMANRKYDADKDGTITIPFTKKPGNKTIILASGDFYSLARFRQQSENYSFSAGFYVDREALLRRQKATIMIRGQLQLNGVQVPLKMLKSATLTLTSVDRFSVKSSKKISNFKLHDEKFSTYTFRVPKNLRSLSFSLRVTLQNACQGKEETKNASARFVLNQIDRTSKVATLHLTKAKGEYFLDVLDRTGVARKYQRVSMRFRHKHLRYQIYKTLYTNHKGRIELGPLKDITSLYARNPEGGSRRWDLRGDRHNCARTLQGKVGENLKVPYLGNASKPQRSELALFERRGGSFAFDRFSALRIQDGYVVVADLPAGDYTLYLKGPNKAISIRLTQGTHRAGHTVGKHRILQTNRRKPVHIVSAKLGAKALTVRIGHATKLTRVHVFATRYMPEYALYHRMNIVSYPTLSRRRLSRLASLYRVGRDIGAEYRYILERKNAKKYPGNSLKRPSLLLNPWAISKTKTGRLSGSGGGGFDGSSHGLGRLGTRGRGGGYGGRGWHRSSINPNLDFLPTPAAVLINLKPDAKGVVTIPRKQLGAHQHIRVLATDWNDTAIRELDSAEQKVKFKDLRLHSKLAANKHYTEQRQISVIKKKGRFVLSDITTSQHEPYDSLGQIYSLFMTLKNNANLRKFGFILNWHKLKDAKKRALYSKHACHELHFFLYKKDPTFFKTVVRGYLQNKKDKTFMDHWLLGADLKPYTTPWAYGRLNIVERILLAQRITREHKHTARHIKELFALLPKNLRRFNRLFKTALQTSALETKGAMARLRDLRDKLEEKSREAPAKTAAEPSAPAPPAAAQPAPAMRRARKPRRYRRRYRRSRSRRGFFFGAKMKKKARKESAGEFDSFKADMAKRQKLRQYYRQVEKTKEWVENNYYKLPIHRQNASLVRVNAFWRDYAKHTKGAFLSRNVAEATRNFTEMMFALSVLDLPFVSPKHKTTFKGVKMTTKAAGHMIIFHKQILQTKAAKEKTPILVSQNFFKYRDRYRYVKGERRDKYVSDEFLTQTVYGCQVVVTNPTSSRQKLDLLLQIPRGAIHVLNGRYTRSTHISLGAYQTRRFDYYFYFPRTGTFAQFPVHVAKNSKLIAFAKPATLKAVNKLSKIDKESWEYISQNGTLKQVLAFLRTHNLYRLSLGKIAWRMSARTPFRKVIALLRQRHAYSNTLWSYGFKHNDLATMRTYLQKRSYFVRRCGAALQSKLLTINPVVRKTYQHMEYSPLVNARVHNYGTKGRIVNDRFKAQYRRYLRVLRYRNTLSASDLMALVYYMLLQDRVEDALGFFARVNAKALKTQLQYDYFNAYLSFYKEELKTARQIVAKYKNYPVVRWQKMFANVAAQLDEIDGKGVKITDKKDRDQKQTKLAATEASFDFKVESRKVMLSFQHVKAFQVSYYLMDIELLFSRNPFVQQHKGQFAYIRPNLRQSIQASKGRKMSFTLPKQFHNSNVIIEITAAGLKKTKAYYANSIEVQTIENYGQLKVSHADTNKALSKVYIKVYARYKNGSVKFYKDGYTDLRGRFDYAALSTNDLDNVKRFSILILSAKHGAVVREAAPPKQ